MADISKNHIKKLNLTKKTSVPYYIMVMHKVMHTLDRVNQPCITQRARSRTFNVHSKTVRRWLQLRFNDDSTAVRLLIDGR